jgi:hypothetical protein
VCNGFEFFEGRIGEFGSKTNPRKNKLYFCPNVPVYNQITQAREEKKFIFDVSEKLKWVFGTGQRDRFRGSPALERGKFKKSEKSC